MQCDLTDLPVVACFEFGLNVEKKDRSSWNYITCDVPSERLGTRQGIGNKQTFFNAAKNEENVLDMTASIVTRACSTLILLWKFGDSPCFALQARARLIGYYSSDSRQHPRNVFRSHVVTGLRRITSHDS